MALHFLLVVALSISPALSYHEEWMNGVSYEGPHTHSVRVEQFGHHYHTRFTRQDDNQPENSTITDNHRYYTSTYYPPGLDADSFWVDLESEANVEEIIESTLSDQYRFFQVHPLLFEFPIYGHIISEVAVTTGGFLYTGTFYHPYIHVTQYIAPLQADFNPNITDNATILIHGTSERFTAQWNMVHNHDHVENGTFTFQVSIFPSGEIHFAYKEIPLRVSEIDSADHPVEVGLSDSFYVDTLFPGQVLVRSIFEYNKIRLTANDSLAYSAYVIAPLSNCIMAQSCDECVNITAISDFVCGWCDDLTRCSDGFDRHRQEWFTSGCVDNANLQCTGTSTSSPNLLATPSPTPMQSSTNSEIIATHPATPSPTPMQSPSTESEFIASSQSKSDDNLSDAAVVGIAIGLIVLIIVLAVVMVVFVVVLYAYRHPNSRLGLFLIEHRPGTGSLNKTKSASYKVETGKTILEEQ